MQNGAEGGVRGSSQPWGSSVLGSPLSTHTLRPPLVLFYQLITRDPPPGVAERWVLALEWGRHWARALVLGVSGPSHTLPCLDGCQGSVDLRTW